MLRQNPAVCYVRARLRRKLFAWFALTILLSGIAVGCAMSWGDGGRLSFMRDVEHARGFLGDRFADVWSDAPSRDAFAATIQRDFNVTVRVRDASGGDLAAFGPACEGPNFDVPVTSRAAVGERLGTVSICAERYSSHPWRIALPVGIAWLVLWAAANVIAKKLARPIGEVARVASEIGAGNLGARVKVGHHHHGEIALLACTINHMAEKIEAHVSEQRQLLAQVSHELRTPLARIRLLTELGRERHDAKTFDELDREVMEIDALVGDLLASSRIDFQVLSQRPVDVVEAAGRALERAGEDPAKLVVEVADLRDSDPAAGVDPAAPVTAADVDVEVRADATLLARALANLIDNARKHGGGLEVLRVGRRNGRLSIAAEDQGSGFVDGEEARVFEPFFKRGEAGSLGLGLSLVKRIAESHQGAAFAENRPGGGARVGIELPLG
ncbi:MAG TPA: HAMP domain-containing sensor histidine kinase [Byssovorax sp.]|jgi:signal transduction histidine kinase